MSQQEKLLIATEWDLLDIKLHNMKQKDSKKQIVYRLGQTHPGKASPKTYDIFVKPEFFADADFIIRRNPINPFADEQIRNLEAWKKDDEEYAARSE